MEQKTHDGAIGDHAGLRGREKDLEQQSDDGRKNHDPEDPRQEIGENQLGPGAPEVPQRLDQDSSCR